MNDAWARLFEREADTLAFWLGEEFKEEIMNVPHLSLEDVREYVEAQIDKDMRNPDYLTIEEHMRMWQMLVQIEQAEASIRQARALENLCDLMNGFDNFGFRVKQI